MRRWYCHDLAYYDGERVTCSACGAELDMSLLSPRSYTRPMAFYVELEDLPGVMWIVNVWNCRASLVATTRDRRRDYRLRYASEDLEREAEELARKSVDEQGGAINISGLYSPSEELVAFIAREAGRGIEIET